MSAIRPGVSGSNTGAVLELTSGKIYKGRLVAVPGKMSEGPEEVAQSNLIVLRPLEEGRRMSRGIADWVRIVFGSQAVPGVMVAIEIPGK